MSQWVFNSWLVQLLNSLWLKIKTEKNSKKDEQFKILKMFLYINIFYGIYFVKTFYDTEILNRIESLVFNFMFYWIYYYLSLSRDFMDVFRTSHITYSSLKSPVPSQNSRLELLRQSTDFRSCLLGALILEVLYICMTHVNCNQGKPSLTELNCQCEYQCCFCFASLKVSYPL